MMRVAVLYNAVAPDAPKAEQDVLVQVEAVTTALESLGHEAVPFPCTLDLAAAQHGLEHLAPDAVFNLLEALAGSDWLAMLATALLDAMRLPYTGNHTGPLMLTNDKLLTKERLLLAGLPTPDWVEMDPSPPIRATLDQTAVFQPHAPYILKTVTEHASFGLDEHSLVCFDDEASVRAELHRMTAALGRDCFAERFVDGREFNLSVLAGSDGPQVLPPAEIDFSAFPSGKPRIVGTRAKWEEGSFEYSNTPRRFCFPHSDDALVAKLQNFARTTWCAFRLGGYARVDFRVDAAGQPWILEINANPCLSPDAGFAAALAQAAIPWQTAVQRILDDALAT